MKTVSYSRLHRHAAEYSFTAGPAEWLRYLLDARYVVTNSFHGFAFSLNFQKEFFFELPPERSGVGSRLADLARRYGLTGRELTKADRNETPDFTQASRLLAEDRGYSVEFIERRIIQLP